MIFKNVQYRVSEYEVNIIFKHNICTLKRKQIKLQQVGIFIPMFSQGHIQHMSLVQFKINYFEQCTLNSVFQHVVFG